MHGGTLLPHAAFDASTILQRIAHEKVTYLPGTPTLYQSLLAGPYRDYDLASLRIACTGGAMVPIVLVGEMRRELHIGTVITAYGLSETCGTVSMCVTGDDDATIASTAGRPLPGTEVRLVDEAGQDVPVGTPGEILVRGNCVMVGYFNNPAATREAVDAEGWLHTGDVAVQDARGYLTITDRKKDMVVVGGFNVYPAEVERIMSAHPAILQLAIIGVPDPRLGEVPKAFVVLRPGATADEASLIAWCRDNMANYKVPRCIEIVTALPVTASGKVQKFTLRDNTTP
jgi:acyl-CoA synthetase (AMP-forming)/AMP-acid ligase II